MALNPNEDSYLAESSTQLEMGNAVILADAIVAELRRCDEVASSNHKTPPTFHPVS
jgi:hypothetical protein